ncbi:MAG TPA: hypothetical protein VJ761_13555, partial [Ktedonobacteraceae bacterium]|nr:hypothetical protein [Ktedonobacteraceae bacterium]
MVGAHPCGRPARVGFPWLAVALRACSCPAGVGFPWLAVALRACSCPVGPMWSSFHFQPIKQEP